MLFRPTSLYPDTNIYSSSSKSKSWIALFFFPFLFLVPVCAFSWLLFRLLPVALDKMPQSPDNCTWRRSHFCLPFWSCPLIYLWCRLCEKKVSVADLSMLMTTYHPTSFFFSFPLSSFHFSVCLAQAWGVISSSFGPLLHLGRDYAKVLWDRQWQLQEQLLKHAAVRNSTCLGHFKQANMSPLFFPVTVMGDFRTPVCHR